LVVGSLMAIRPERFIKPRSPRSRELPEAFRPSRIRRLGVSLVLAVVVGNVMLVSNGVLPS